MHTSPSVPVQDPPKAGNKKMQQMQIPVMNYITPLIAYAGLLFLIKNDKADIAVPSGFAQRRAERPLVRPITLCLL